MSTATVGNSGESSAALDRRRAALASLRPAEPFDALIVGGGIVGAGVARDAAMRGLRVAIVDQHDFAFGTSSRSSRLLHGGLRYLAQGRVALVREASLEKRVVTRIAPHLSQPLAFVFPAYNDAQVPLWKLRIGVHLYDLLCSGRNLGRASSLKPAATAAKLPGIDIDGLTGAVRYYDALTNDARLVLDTLSSAARAGASLVNYVRLEHPEHADGLWTCTVRDTLHPNGESSEVRARMVVNAAGPWADLLKHSRVKLRRTKGVHIVINRSRLPVQDAVVLTEGSRILFVIPWGDRVILGTTDTDFAGLAEDVRTDREDIDYILRVTDEVFPGAHLTDADVISYWAGLRPLIASADGKPSDISRSHEIRRPREAWLDVAGGKLTTYRLMGEQAVDRIVDELKAQKRVKHCRTGDEPLLPPGDPALSFSGVVPPPVSREAVEHYCEREWAQHLDDVMLRRSSWGYYEPDLTGIAERVAGWMAERLGWDAARVTQEMARFAAVPVRPAQAPTTVAETIRAATTEPPTPAVA